MVDLYDRLFRQLNERQAYAVWKSCHKLADALDAEGDIDLFVPLASRANFLLIAKESGFVSAQSSVLRFPHVEHLYGFDEASGKICHMNVYYRLVTGASHLKSHDLPLGEAVLENRVLNERFGVFQADFDTQSTIYAARHHLKKASIFGYLLWLRERCGYLEEYDHIRHGLLAKGVADRPSNSHLPELTESCGFDSLNPRTSWADILKSRRCARSLTRYRRMGSVRSGVVSFWNFGARIFIRLFRVKKNLDHGVVIAVSGVDGAGKSTMVKELESWLGLHFNVVKLHIGRPPPTLLTLPVRLMLMLRLAIARTRGVGASRDIVRVGPSGIVFAIRYLALAYERYRACVTARRLACKGRIVMTDRYPATDVGKMDSPRIGTDARGLTKHLGHLETRLYERMPPADLLLYLDVSAENARKRNKERKKSFKETDSEILRRHRENRELTFLATDVVRVDGNQELPRVLSTLKCLAWKALSVRQS